ncbi:hypothetical protein L6164_000691 [Bauhinia variegata]|uniref:Uncharacterized protein n=1 Tax=Bauhinia variegata TaxID=167791 RepID=A0ACB9Q7J3_BAUVA|nr:hypothetical protein L6164_000691 [Bauhinia variegata]
MRIHLSLRVSLYVPYWRSCKIEKLSDTQCQPESQLKFITEAWLLDFRQNGDDAIVDVEVRTGGARIGDYEYLLSMPMGTLTIESVEKLLAQKQESEKEFEILKGTPPTSMWLKDLDELEKKLEDLDSKGKGGKNENNKKANNVESEADIVANSSMDVEKVAEVAKPIGRGGSRKAPPNKDDDEVQSLQERHAAYNLGPSDDPSAAMKTERTKSQLGRKFGRAISKFSI